MKCIPKLQQKTAEVFNTFGKMSKEIDKIQVTGQSLNFVIFSKHFFYDPQKISKVAGRFAAAAGSQSAAVVDSRFATGVYHSAYCCLQLLCL